MSTEDEIDGLKIIRPKVVVNPQNKCPECGGAMKLISREREAEFVCTKCGVSIPFSVKTEPKTFVKKRQQTHRDWQQDYLAWWLSPKGSK